MKKMLLSLSCSLLLLTSYAHADTTIAALKTGTYSLQGGNPGSPALTYKGTVTIAPQGNNYSLQWTIGKSQTCTGVGILSGNILSVAYYDYAGYISGVVSYELTQDGQLTGQWTGYGSEQQGQEILNWQTALSQ